MKKITGTSRGKTGASSYSSRRQSAVSFSDDHQVFRVNIFCGSSRCRTHNVFRDKHKQKNTRVHTMIVQVMTFPEQTPSVTASSYGSPARTTSATRGSGGGRSAGRSVSFADFSDPEEVEQVEEVEEDIQKEADGEEEAE